MKKIKKKIILMVTFVMMLMQVMPAYAEENSTEEWYELVEEEFETPEEISPGIMPYTQYIMDVMTSLKKISSNKLGMRADVYCISKVQSITITFYLQKKSGSTWVNVASASASASNVSSTAKQMTCTGVSSGTYRAKTITRVVDKYGYAETLTGYSGSIKI